MTAKKKVANTLTSILENPIMKIIQDRSSNIEQVFDEVISWWRYDLLTRKPGPAYIDENFVGTDLDLACLLFELSERGAVINIPNYKSMRAKTVKEGECVISTENRHGKVLGLVANKDVFSFSVKIIDMNVASTEEVGKFRNFSITDLDGDWYDGFKSLGFIPTREENKFLYENKILVDNKIDFTNFVHPNRWSSMFGQYYIITKELVRRLKEESSYYLQEIKEMLNEGISYPSKDAPIPYPESVKIPGKKVKVKSFAVEIDIPENNSKYPTYLHNKENLIELTKRRNYYTYNVVPKLNFAVRTVEYAYYKFGQNRIPSWLKNVKWEDFKDKRTMWERVILFQPKVGEFGVSIKKRLYETTQEVSLDYDNRKGKLKNYIAIILDESGSMDSIKSDVIGTFNDQVDTIKANSSDMESLVSLVTFSSMVNQPKLWNEPYSKLKHITDENYRPNGWTALNDAIMRTINNLEQVEDINDPLTSFLLIILTDGEENYSRKYPGKYNHYLSEKLKQIQDTNRWTVTFIGANQNMDEVSRGLNLFRDNVSEFKATPEGMKKASFQVTLGLSGYYNSRRSGETSVKGFYKDSDKN